MSYESSLHEKDGAWKTDAKIAAGVDDLDNTHPLNCTQDGTLKVVGTFSPSGIQTVAIDQTGTNNNVKVVNYTSPLVVGAVVGVLANTLTTLVTYTEASFSGISQISVSGTVYAKFQLFLNTVLIDTRRTGPERNVEFHFSTPLALVTSDILDIKVTHYQTGVTGDFESTVYGG